MTCSNCGRTIRNESNAREFYDLTLDRRCYREIVDMVRETGGELEAYEELRFEAYIDQVRAVMA